MESGPFQFLTEEHLMVTTVTGIFVAAVIFFHYEVLNGLNSWYHNRNRIHGHLPRRPTILATMFVLLFAHIIEIWAFGAAFWLLLAENSYGAVDGYSQVSFLDCVYFSAACYSTVGWGDLAATGEIRFLAGTEPLVGFMVITWSASFSYLIMIRTWGEED